VAERKVDTPGEPAEVPVTPAQDGDQVGPLLIEIPLWRFGRIKLESYNSKSSLALFALLLLMILIVILSVFEAIGGSLGATLPGISSILGKAGEGLLLLIGVLIGSYGTKKSD
jgi:hypothetical protein